MAKEDFKVTPRESQNDSLLEALGISGEKCRELCNAIHQLYRHSQPSSVSEIISEASNLCKNANELAFVCYVIGAEVTGAAAFEAGVTAAKILGDIESFIGRSMAAKRTPPTGMFSAN